MPTKCLLRSDQPHGCLPGGLIITFITLILRQPLSFGDGALQFFAENWLYYAAPYGVAFLAHKFVPFVRSTFLTPALLAVSGVLLFFRCWIWWFVPGREGPIAWLLYPPACAAVLLLVWMATHVHARLTNAKAGGW
ncbi:hypothetical protein [Archangium lansingense]|uniref:Uncharacterized protein n=1 Tax=Archangium lansingense TaxID=2995310 RepID=A0ABT4A2I4_9BACT|nr:hypothetical protein [Archangium lansinium]MCY1075854.1 hypothetical protein [Archangium lansinium]